MDPRDWLDGFESQVADLQRKAADLTEGLAAATATAESRDGAVAVTVNPHGGLVDLRLGHRACDLGPARLTALILETAREAQRKAADRTMELFRPLGGDTEMMRMIAGFATGGDEGGPRAPYEPEPEPEVEADPGRRVAPPSHPPRRGRRAGGDDEVEIRPW